MKGTRRLAALLAALLTAQFTAAGAGAQALPFIHFTPEHQRVPLPSSSVQTIHQDSQGYIWLGFFSAGLGRYDGHDLELYGREDGLLDATVREIVEDGSGYLWVGSDSGLVVSDQPLTQDPGEGAPRLRFRRRGAWNGNELFRERVRHNFFAAGPNGGLWIVGGRGVTRFVARPDAVEETLFPRRGGSGAGLALAVRRNGDVWASFESGELAVVRPDEPEVSPVDPAPASPTSVLYEDVDGVLWGGCRNGLIWRFDDEAGTFVEVSALLREPVSSILRSRQGELWAASLGEGVLRLRDGKAVRVGHHQGLLSETVWHVAQDREDNLWFAHNAGFSRLRANYRAFQHLTGYSVAGEKPLLPEPSVFAVLPEDERTWIGTGGGLVAHENAVASVLGTADGLPSGSVYSLARDGEGRLWIGTPNGLAILTGDGVRAPPPQAGSTSRTVALHGRRYRLDSYPVGTVYAAERVRMNDADSMWIAGTKGLAVLAGGAWHFMDADDGLPTAGATCLAQDDGIGNVWVGTKDSGLLNLRTLHDSPDGETFLPAWTPGNGAPSASIHNLLFHAGLLWVATPAGLVALDVESSDPIRVVHLLDAAKNLGGDYVMGLAADPLTGHLWVTQNAGLVELDPASGTVQRRLSKSDGLVDNESWVAYSLAVDGAGRVFQATPKGVTLYDPRLDAHVPASPRLLVRSLAFSDSRTGRNEIVLRYAALTFVNEHLLRYRTRLLPTDPDWSEESTAVSFRGANLPAFLLPRRYVLEVTARTGGPWPREATLRYPFEVRPAWWKSWWAVTLFGLALAASAYRWYAWRTAFLKRRADDLEELFSKRSAAARVYASELETLDQIVQSIHREVDLEAVMEALIEQGLKLVPQAEKGVFSVYDRERGHFEIVANYGWQMGILTGMTMGVEESMRRYSREAERLDEGIFLVRDPEARPGAESMGHLPRVEAMLSIEVTLGKSLGGFLVLDIFRGVEEVERLDVRTLRRYRRHAISALDKARTMAELEERRREAEAASRAKSAFLANVSHELRTPLNSIIGFSEVLGDKLADGEPRHLKFIRNIHAAGTHLLTLINDILDLSKVEAGRAELRVERVSVEQIVTSVMAMMGGLAMKNNIELRTDLPEDLPEVRLDGPKVKQILYNLVANAIKFSPEGGEVRAQVDFLTAAASPIGRETVLLTVRDQGIGIDRRDQARIFEEFQQVSSSESRKFPGTGLGLTLVRRYAELHGGIVEVESAPGKGAIFRALLPNQPRSKIRPTSAAFPPASAP